MSVVIQYNTPYIVVNTQNITLVLILSSDTKTTD